MANLLVGGQQVVVPVQAQGQAAKQLFSDLAAKFDFDGSIATYLVDSIGMESLDDFRTFSSSLVISISRSLAKSRG